MVLKKPVVAFTAALFAASPAFNPAWAQIAGTANLGGPQPMVSTPIPDGDFAAVAKRLGLVESAKPARELIKGWQRPRKILVGVDNNTNRLAWLQAAAPGVQLVAVRSKCPLACCNILMSRARPNVIIMAMACSASGRVRTPCRLVITTVPSSSFCGTS